MRKLLTAATVAATVLSNRMRLLVEHTNSPFCVVRRLIDWIVTTLATKVLRGYFDDHNGFSSRYWSSDQGQLTLNNIKRQLRSRS